MPGWTTDVVDDLIHSTAGASEALCIGPHPATFPWQTPGRSKPLPCVEGGQRRQKETKVASAALLEGKQEKEIAIVCNCGRSRRPNRDKGGGKDRMDKKT